jgi:hypothetical protein
MLRLNRSQKSFVRLPQRTMSESGLLEREDIQAMITASPEHFFEELGERITLLAQEVCPDDHVDDRIDLLAADEDGSAVVIELKRGNHKMHLLQALSYAGMLSNLDGPKFIERVARFARKSTTQIEETIEDFVEGGVAVINHSQRVILLAEEFDYSVLITAEWLSDKYKVDVRCYRLRLAADQGAEFLTCERVYPPAELTEQAARVRRLTSEYAARYQSWDEALASIDNTAIVDFFKQEIDGGRTGYVARKILNWYQDGHRRFWVAARKSFAYGWQMGRFQGDLEFWRSKLGGADADVAIVGRHNNRVRFRLRTSEQIAAFRDAITGPLAKQPFVNTAIGSDDADGENEGEDV